MLIYSHWTTYYMHSLQGTFDVPEMACLVTLSSPQCPVAVSLTEAAGHIKATPVDVFAYHMAMRRSVGSQRLGSVKTERLGLG